MQNIKTFLNFFLVSGIYYFKDKLPIRANAIAYSIVVSVIPLLTVLMRFANIQQEELIKNLNELFLLYGIVGAQPILDVIQDILNKANTISGIGVIFLIYSSLNIFQQLEESANQVFKASSRGFLIRTSIFTTWLILLPVLLFFLFSLSGQLEVSLKPPHNLMVQFNNNEYFILKSDKTLDIYDAGFELVETVDFLKRTDLYVLDRKIIINDDPFTYDLTGDFLKTLLKEPVALVVDKDFILIGYKPNILFFSYDRGLRWDFRYFLFSNKGKSYEFPVLESLYYENDRIYALLTLDDRSYFLILEKNFFDVLENVTFDAHYNRMYIQNGKIYLTGAGNYIYTSKDTSNWKTVILPQENTYINDAHFFENEVIYLTPSKRVAIFQDGKVFYPLLRLNYLDRIRFLKLQTDDQGFLVGDREIRYTLNRGRDWFLVRFYDTGNNEIILNEIYDIHRISENEKTFLFTGKERSLYVARIFSVTVDEKTNILLVKFRVTHYYTPEKWRLTVPAFLHYILNFMYIVLTISLFYRILPNTKVPLSSAFLGGFVAGTGILVFLILFRFLLPTFTSTRFIYGIWFSIPVLLIILLSSIQIFLYGLEVAKVHMKKLHLKYDAIGKMKFFSRTS